MAGFYLGNSGRPNKQEEQVREQNLFLYRSNEEEIYNRGFEIWPQHYNQQEELNFENQLSFGVGPSRTGIRSFINVSDHDQPSRSSGFTVMRHGGLGGSGGVSCQDCGNQAKKDCSHLRCRTCCKSRGLECQTHVKSTWVPAAKRRERQQALLALQQQQQQRNQQEDEDQFRQNTKRLRENHGTTVSIACTRLPTTSGLELSPFPAEVNSPAVFRGVKVSAMDEVEEQFAYQTAVNIGGHVFKGILYDQGPEGRHNMTGGETSSGRGGDGDTAAKTVTVAATGPSTSNPTVTLLDPSLYPAPLNPYMAGTQFFSSSRS